MGKTSIQWTEASWNPVRGCRKVSLGCKNCYANVFAERFRGVPGHPYERGFDPRFVPSALDAPTRWRAPRRVFVNSMSDLFLEDFSNEQIAAVFGVMAQTPRHTYQVLTKRARRMREWFEWVASHEQNHGPPPDEVVTTSAVNFGAEIDQLVRPWPLPNVWIGVSVEDQKRADERIPELLRVPARVRFLSCEPLLEAVTIPDWTFTRSSPVLRFEAFTEEAKRAYPVQPSTITAHGIDWIIVGGESGPGARPFNPSWAKDIIAQCRAAGVACFVKQLGANVLDFSGRLKDRKGGDMTEWSEDLRVRQFPEVRP